MVGPGPAITGPPGESMEAQSDSFIAKPAQLRSESKTNKGKQKALNKMNLIKEGNKGRRKASQRLRFIHFLNCTLAVTHFFLIDLS
jgi:hypothetical protein